MYKPIDQYKSGRKLKIMLETAGYDVKYIQDYLQLNCPQTVYRWYKGKTLPSLEHLLALSKLLKVHVEELLVLEGDALSESLLASISESQTKRLLAYGICVQKVA